MEATGWPPAAIYRDVYYLPLKRLVDGDYRLHVGWYEAETGTRLSLADGSDSQRLLDFTLAQGAISIERK